MKLKELILKRERILAPRNEEAEITSLACDLREVKEGSLFFCFKGTKVDSHTLAVQAVEKGAVAVVCEKILPLANYAVVRDSRKMMARAAKRFYGGKIDKMKLIAVTGTNGKTSTTYILESILRLAGYRTGVIGTCGIKIGGETFESDMTTPDPIKLHEIFARMYDEGVQAVLMEASAHSIYLRKLEGVKADVAVFTNLTQDHLDFFKTMERYKRAKTSYFSPRYTRCAAVNIDDETGREIAENAKVKTFTYSIDNVSDFTALNISEGLSHTEYVLSCENAMRPVKSMLSGRFNVYNTLAAACAASALGIDVDTITEGIAATKAIDGRFNVLQAPSGAHIVIDYAHTPDGLQSILKSARELTPRKLISVFGCGGNRDKTKRPIMGEVACKFSDLVILTSDNPRFERPEDIICDIERGVCKTCYYITQVDREKAIAYALDFAGKDDTVVIAGKGHETYQEIEGKKYRFSDLETVRKYLGE